LMTPCSQIAAKHTFLKLLLSDKYCFILLLSLKYIIDQNT
jgi:hypothetical protein